MLLNSLGIGVAKGLTSVEPSSSFPFFALGGAGAKRMFELGSRSSLRHASAFWLRLFLGSAVGGTFSSNERLHAGEHDVDAFQ